MDWTEITIEVASRDIDEVTAIANLAVPYGIYIEDYSDLIEQSWEIAHVDLIEQELLEKDRSMALVHIYISKEDNALEAVEYLTERLNANGIDFSLIKNNVDDSDWLNGWKKFFKCTEIGEKLVVRPSWENYDNKSNRKVLSIDPGAAFGTGTHATTSLCLAILERYVNENSTVLDIGCGSGILSIASVLLGAKYSDGVDIDEQSVKVAKENAELNGVSDKTNYIVGNLAEKIDGNYSIVCANIVADIIIELLENVSNYMTEDGIIVTSGIIDMRETDVLSAFDKYGFKIVEELKRDNWCAFVCRKED